MCPPDEVLWTWAEGATGAEHLASCRRCTLQIERLRVIARELSTLSMAGPAPGFTAALKRRIAMPSSAAQGRRGLLLSAAAMLSAAIAMLVVRDALPTTHRPPQRTDAFVARGAAESTRQRLGFEVYVHEPGRPAVLLAQDQTVSAAAGYSFVVWNRSHEQQRLMLFAVDAQREVHWFYPSFIEPGTDPQSIAVPAAPEVRALAEGVTPDHVALGAFRIVGLFTSAALRVSSVEARLGDGGLDALRHGEEVIAYQVWRAEVHEL